MIKEVEAGNVGTLIVKDMSRLGRNYLQVGFYTEILFPQKDVRFLAINNSIDSNNASDNDFAPFLNIMNEFYAKDTSNKIKAVFDARMKDGKRCSGSIPYGYNRLPSDKQTLVVDPVASEGGKRIFLLANEGKSPRAIAEILTEEKVLIPAAYAKEYHPEQYNGIKFADPYIWGISAIRTILSRQEYLGHTVLRKSVSTNFKLHKRKTTDEDEQYVFYNTHEPIISQELWDSVMGKMAHSWKRSLLRSFIIGIVITTIVLTAIFGTYYALFIRQNSMVSPEQISISAYSLTDEQITFRLELLDGYCGGTIKTYTDENRNLYISVLRTVIKEELSDGETEIMNYGFNHEKKDYIAVYYGTPNNCELIWKKGDLLPTAPKDIFE